MAKNDDLFLLILCVGNLDSSDSLIWGLSCTLIRQLSQGWQSKVASHFWVLGSSYQQGLSLHVVSSPRRVAQASSRCGLRGPWGWEWESCKASYELSFWTAIAFLLPHSMAKTSHKVSPESRAGGDNTRRCDLLGVILQQSTALPLLSPPSFLSQSLWENLLSGFPTLALVTSNFNSPSNTKAIF